MTVFVLYSYDIGLLPFEIMKPAGLYSSKLTASVDVWEQTEKGLQVLSIN